MAITVTPAAYIRQAGTTASTNITITPHASTQVGDLMVVVVCSSDDAGPAYTLSGWTARVSGTQTGTMRTWIFTKTRQVGETTYTMVRTGATGTTAVCVTVAGWDSAAALVVSTLGTRAGSGGAAVTTAPTITATGAGVCLLLATERTSAASGNPTVNNGFTRIVWAEDGFESVLVATKSIAAGAVGATSVTYGTTHASNSAALQIAITEAVATHDPGVGVDAFDGAGDAVKVFYTSAVGEASTPAALIPMRRGFRTVSEMLATPGATWAHRGGSLSWPEMSLHAYTQAVARGYGALEVSIQRSSDGVWFGCHDVDLARVTGNPALTTDVRTMTWAAINAYQIAVGASGAPKPFMRWSEILDTYADTHVLIVDPKNSIGGSGNMAAFISKMQAEVDPQRTIIKWGGKGGYDLGFPQACAVAGFPWLWGYYYQTDYTNGDLAASQAAWSLLGMDIGATTAWTGTGNVLSYGKPVVGHIAASQAEYNTAIAKGASMVQCSNVANITPVSWWT